jgi:putative oxidoreductase
MKPIVRALIDWPQHVAQHLYWLAPLFTRLAVGWVFMWSGWGKLTNLPFVTENFAGWGIPVPGVTAPLTAGIEFIGGICLLLGLFTRIAAGALGVVMIVATLAVQWSEVDSLLTLAGLEETLFLALFLWLAIDGPGRLSLDRLMQERWP